jgi:hypothetical protein
MEVTVRRARGRPVDRLTSAAAHWVPHALKTANNILSVIEIAFYALTFAIWASGLPRLQDSRGMWIVDHRRRHRVSVDRISATLTFSASRVPFWKLQPHVAARSSLRKNQ